jgi:hypothetical protein
MMTATDMAATIRMATATANSGRVKRVMLSSVALVVDWASVVITVAVTIIVDDGVNQLVVIEVVPV